MMKRYQLCVQLKEVTHDKSGQQVNVIVNSEVLEFNVSDQYTEEVPIRTLQVFKHANAKMELHLKAKLNERYGQFAPSPAMSPWTMALMKVAYYDAESSGCEHEPVPFMGGVKCRLCFGWMTRP